MKRPRRKIPRTSRTLSFAKRIKRLRFKGLRVDPGADPMTTFEATPSRYCYYEIAGAWCRCELLPNGQYGNCAPYNGTSTGPWCGDKV